MTPEQLKQIKERLLKWKEEHQEEYNRFAQYMDNCESDALFQFYQSIALQSPDFIKKWEQCYNDDTKENFEDIKLLFQQKVLPKQILLLYQEHSHCTPEHKKAVSLWWKLAQLWRNRKHKTVEISAPMIYTWLFFGKSFESMVKLINKQLKNAGTDNADKWNMSYAVESIITTSIQSGFRTREQWDKYFSMEKAIEEGSVTDWAMSSVGSAIDANLRKQQMDNELMATRQQLIDTQQELTEIKDKILQISQELTIKENELVEKDGKIRELDALMVKISAAKDKSEQERLLLIAELERNKEDLMEARNTQDVEVERLRIELQTANEALKVGGRQKSKYYPLSYYIDTPDKETILEIVRCFIAENNTGFGLAIPYFALTKLGLLRNIADDKEYSIALNLQFRDSMPELKSESSCRQALGNLKKPQYIVQKGKRIEAPLVEDDKHRILLERLIDELHTALHSL